MRSAFFKLVALSFLVAIGARAQINPNQVAWPQPSCSDPTAHWTPGANACLPVTTTGGMPVNNPQYTGTMRGPTFTSSVNGTLMVMAPPYNAYCDAIHDDQGAIQAAFNDSASQGKPVQFPPSTCLTSTIVYKGQSFFGAGKSMSIIKGMPGQDVFQGVNSTAMSYLPEPRIHDISIIVDNSINKAATAGGGDNTFPDRISGTSGGGGTIGGAITPLTNPVAIGPEVFGPGITDGCAGASISAGSHALNCSGALFNGLGNSPDVIGQPITVNGAGASGAPLVTTIATIVDGNNITLTAAAATTVSGASGTWGTGLTTPWYIGNCGIALPDSDGTWLHGNPLLRWGFKNVNFGITSGPARGNHSCGIFAQAMPYAWSMEQITFTQLYGGLIEALPLVNYTSPYQWSPDTNSYKDMNFNFDSIPMVTYNGASREYHGVNIYGGEQIFTYGLFQLAPNGQGGNITSHFSSYFYECFPPNSGENSRFIGIVTMENGGGLDECGTNPTANLYTAWYAHDSVVTIPISGINIYGNANVFYNNIGNFPPNLYNDFGQENSFQTSVATGRKSYMGRTQAPVNALDGSFLLNGNSTTPFANGSDLVMQCKDFNFAYNTGSGGGTPPGCTNDPSGTEITKSYVHLTAAAYPTGWQMWGSGTSQGVGPLGKPMVIGDRIPQAKTLFVMQGRCNTSPCPNSIQIFDNTTSTLLVNSGVTLTSTWSVQTLAVDFSSIPVGHVIGLQTPSPWSGGVTSVDVAFYAFEPYNKDILAQIPPQPPASATVAGLAKCGTGTVCAGDGTISTSGNGATEYNAVSQGGVDNTGASDTSATITSMLMGFTGTGNTQVIYFPPGTYNISNGVQLACATTSCNGIIIRGAGKSQTIFQSLCNNGYAWWWNGSAVSGSYWFGTQMKDLAIKDTSGSGACNSLLRRTQMANYIDTNVELDGAQGHSYSTGTVSITNGTTALTGVGTTFTAAMVPGVLRINNKPQWVCAFVSATALTLCGNWQQTTASGAGYSLSYGGQGFLMDGGTNFIQYGRSDNLTFVGDLMCVASVPSTSGSIGVSRNKFYGGFCNPQRIPNSIGFALGQYTDSIQTDMAINNAVTCWFADGAHDNKIGGECEDDGTPTVSTTCNGGVASQTCLVGAEFTGPSNGTSYGNVVDGILSANLGVAVQRDSTNAINLYITNLRAASFSNLNNYSLEGTTGCPASGSTKTVTIHDYDCDHIQVAQTVNLVRRRPPPPRRRTP